LKKIIPLGFIINQLTHLKPLNMKKKNKFLLIIVFAIAALAIGKTGNAQTPWVLAQSVSNVNFYYQLSDCGGDEVVFLKFENNNPGTVTVTWDELFDTQGGTAQPGQWGTLHKTLPTGTTQQADCTDSTCAECLITPEKMMQTYKAVASGFAYSNITVTP
jgi:hypothetical protein